MSHRLLELIRRQADPGFRDSRVNRLVWELSYGSGRRLDTGRRVTAVTRGLRDAQRAARSR